MLFPERPDPLAPLLAAAALAFLVLMKVVA